MRRVFAALACLLLTVSMITACAVAGTGKSSQNADCIAFIDALGRQVRIPKNSERVAALIGSFADVWMLAGGTVCATADDAWDDFGLELGDAVNMGSTKSPNLELLFEADPDFVIASASTAANVEWQQTLEDAGIPVAYFDVSSFENYLAMLDICTEITGRRDLYEINGLEIQKQIETLTAEFAKQEITDTHKKVLFLRASAGYIRAKNSEGSILGEMLADLGCVNIADSDASLLENLSIESILEQDPYHIFIVQVGDDEAAVKENITTMMEENPAWRQLTAVKEERVHYMDKHLFNLKPNARWAEAYEQLINVLQE